MNLLQAFDRALRQWQYYLEQHENVLIDKDEIPETAIFRECLAVFEKEERAAAAKESQPNSL